MNFRPVKLLIALSFLAPLFLNSASAMPILYGVINTSGTGGGAGDGSGSGDDQGSTLVTIDQTTGSLTEVGAIGFGRVSGLVYDPVSDTLFATGGNTTFNPFDYNTQLLSINRSTGAGTEIGPLNQDDPPIEGTGNVSDLARRADGSIYGFTPTDTLDLLLNLNLGTGNVDGFIQNGWGNTGLGDSSGNGIVFDSSGILIHANDQSVSTIDPVTGVTVVGANIDFLTDLPAGIPQEDFLRVSALDIDPITGQIYASVISGFGGMGGSNFNGSLSATLDPTTGFIDYIGLSTLNQKVRKLDAIAFVQVPEPSTLALLALGLLGVSFARRRHA